MKYAVISDVHANLQACRAVLSEIAQFKVDRIVCLGDLVGYGPRPAETLAELRAACDEVVMGNHDAAVAGVLDPECFSEDARQGIEWTTAQLDDAARDYLNAIPYAFVHDTRQGDVLFVHASAHSPEAFYYIEQEEDARLSWAASDARIMFIGHTHEPRIDVLAPDGSHKALFTSHLSLKEGHRYIVNVGSAGMSRDHDFRASWCVFDDEAGRVVYRRTDFDVQAFKQDVLARTSFMEQSRHLLEKIDHREGVAARDRSGFHPASGASKRRIQVGGAGPRRVVRVPRSLEPASMPVSASPLAVTPARKVNRHGMPKVWVAGACLLLAALASWAFFARPSSPASLEHTSSTRSAAQPASALAGAESIIAAASPYPLVQPNRENLGFHARRFTEAKGFHEITLDGVDIDGVVYTAKNMRGLAGSVVWVAGTIPGTAEPARRNLADGVAGYALYTLRFTHPGTYRIDLSIRSMGRQHPLGENEVGTENNTIWVGHKDAGPDSSAFTLFRFEGYTLKWRDTGTRWVVKPEDAGRDLRFTLGCHKDGVVYDRVAFIRVDADAD